MRSIFKFIILLVIVNILAGCKHNRLDIDTSNVTVEPVVFKRLDKDVFALNEQNVLMKTKEYRAKYSTFYDRYITSIINNGGVNDSLYSQTLLKFVNDKELKEAYGMLIKEYSDNDVELVGDELTEVVKRFKVLFPKRQTPKQYVTFMSGFNMHVVKVDSTLGVGLDMYLGDNNMFYSMMQLPKFRTRTMNKEHLLPDLVRGWMLNEFDNADPVNNLLNHMIFYGKIFYTCDALIPEVSDSLKFGYTTAQMNYCNQYEKICGAFLQKTTSYMIMI